MNIYTIIIGAAAIVSAISTIVTNVGKAGKVSKNSVDKYVDSRLDSKLDTIVNTLNDMKQTNAEEEAQNLRFNCLNFAGDLHLGLPKTKHQYEEIFRMEDRYDAYITKYNIKNNLMEEEMNFVHEMYRSLNKKG